MPTNIGHRHQALPCRTTRALPATPSACRLTGLELGVPTGVSRGSYLGSSVCISGRQHAAPSAEQPAVISVAWLCTTPRALHHAEGAAAQLWVLFLVPLPASYKCMFISSSSDRAGRPTLTSQGLPPGDGSDSRRDWTDQHFVFDQRPASHVSTLDHVHESLHSGVDPRSEGAAVRALSVQQHAAESCCLVAQGGQRGVETGSGPGCRSM